MSSDVPCQLSKLVQLTGLLERDCELKYCCEMHDDTCAVRYMMAYCSIHNECIQFVRAALQSFGVSLCEDVSREIAALVASHGLELSGD